MAATKIDWADVTINPITGCRNGCEYCYARRFASRLAGRCGYPAENPFKPTFHPDKLDHIRRLPGESKRVFLDSMGDWFSEGVSPAWIHRVIQVVHEKPEHQFLVLTKRPDRIQEMLHCTALPKNLWLGVSVTRQADLWRISLLKESIPSSTKRFISFEPLLGPVYQPGQKLGGVDWVIIGAQTGPGKVAPDPDWIRNVIMAASPTPTFLKDNLRPFSPVGIFQEFPEVLR